MIFKPLKFVLRNVLKFTTSIITIGIIYIISTGKTTQVINTAQKYITTPTLLESIQNFNLLETLQKYNIVKIIPNDTQYAQNSNTQNATNTTNATNNLTNKITNQVTNESTNQKNQANLLQSQENLVLYYPSFNTNLPIYLTLHINNLNPETANTIKQNLNFNSATNQNTNTQNQQQLTFDLFSLPDYTPVKLHLNYKDPVTLHCKVLTSKNAQALGYMYKPKIGKYECLIFAFNKSSVVPFHMKNVNFPLDIIFLDKNLNVISVINNAPSCKTQSCPQYYSPKAYRVVIEMQGKNWQEFTH